MFRSKAGDLIIGTLVPVLLLPLPLFAATKLGVSLSWAAVYVLLVGGLTFGAYARDKRQARESLWRISEARLHLLELLGGWPGAFLAQRVLRHKNSKLSYQFAFVLIVLTHQFLAYDSLHGWRLCRQALSAMK